MAKLQQPPFLPAILTRMNFIASGLAIEQKSTNHRAGTVRTKALKGWLVAAVRMLGKSAISSTSFPARIADPWGEVFFNKGQSGNGPG